MSIGVTTVQNYSSQVKEEATRRAAALGLCFCPRKGTLEEMESLFSKEGFLVYGKKMPYYYTKGEEYHFHFGTAVLRREQMMGGHEDRLCRLLPQVGRCSVLDATFGQGGDSLIMSWFLGDRGTVTSLEKSIPLYEIGRSAVSSFEDRKEEELTLALRRIRLHHEDFMGFLKRQAPKSFDVAYFDPMFKAPVKRKENHMEGFRRAASYDEVTEEVLMAALQVVRKRIIVKERPFSHLFRKGIFSKVYSRKGQSTAYGVIDV